MTTWMSSVLTCKENQEKAKQYGCQVIGTYGSQKCSFEMKLSINIECVRRLPLSKQCISVSYRTPNDEICSVEAYPTLHEVL